MKRTKKNTFEPAEKDAYRRPFPSPDDFLPVRNMVDWGCNGDVIREPRYADRAYKLCSMVGTEAYNKIIGQVWNLDPPAMLAKQKLFKPAFRSEDTISAKPGMSPQLKDRDLDHYPRVDFRKRKKK